MVISAVVGVGVVEVGAERGSLIVGEAVTVWINVDEHGGRPRILAVVRVIPGSADEGRVPLQRIRRPRPPSRRS